MDVHLDPGGEDGLVVEDSVAQVGQVQVVVLDPRPHTKPWLQAARPGLQKSRLGEEKKVGQGGGERGIFGENQTESCFIFIYKKAQTGGVGEGLKRKRYLDEWDFTYHHSFQN